MAQVDLTWESGLPTGVTGTVSAVGDNAKAGDLLGGLLGISTRHNRVYYNLSHFAYVDINLATLAGMSVGTVRGYGGYVMLTPSLTVASSGLANVPIIGMRANSGNTFLANLALLQNGVWVIRRNTSGGIVNQTITCNLLDGEVHEFFFGVDITTAGSSRVVYVEDGVTVADITWSATGLTLGSGISIVRMGSNTGDAAARQYSHFDANYLTDSLTPAAPLAEASGDAFIAVTASVPAAGDELVMTFTPSRYLDTLESFGPTVSGVSLQDTGAILGTLYRTNQYEARASLRGLVLSIETPTVDLADVDIFTSAGVLVADDTGVAVDNDSTQTVSSIISGYASPVPAGTRTLQLVTTNGSPTWTSDDEDVATVNASGLVTLQQAAGGVANISDGITSVLVEFLPRTVSWEVGDAEQTGTGVGATIAVPVTLTGYSDGAAVGTYPDVYPAAVPTAGLTFDGFTGSSPDYTANFMVSESFGTYTAYVAGASQTLLPAVAGSAAVTDLVATPSDSAVVLTWEEATDAPGGYVVYRAIAGEETLLATGVTATTYTDDFEDLDGDAPAGTPLAYRVALIDENDIETGSSETVYTRLTATAPGDEEKVFVIGRGEGGPMELYLSAESDQAAYEMSVALAAAAAGSIDKPILKVRKYWDSDYIELTGGGEMEVLDAKQLLLRYSWTADDTEQFATPGMRARATYFEMRVHGTRIDGTPFTSPNGEIGIKGKATNVFRA